MNSTVRTKLLNSLQVSPQAWAEGLREYWQEKGITAEVGGFSTDLDEKLCRADVTIFVYLTDENHPQQTEVDWIKIFVTAQNATEDPSDMFELVVSASAQLENCYNNLEDKVAKAIKGIENDWKNLQAHNDFHRWN
ncbi:hypothetical protein BWI97_15885 [Siphonobacter sp. BAB-5405]|uniref:hypothetical protein n=1 Tax=Siphonobacter sp. BAB-5405 TaxID=1864825 RepID=UPI000C80A9EB|nr:hypothetical protein [Siphonobacter sp. BAB-5405]PMD94876.1 hypothetical protein BWI97_15885 [Siphonobacter sp. BAB-5405]